MAGASAVLNAYLDTGDKGGCVNILEVWHSKYFLSSKNMNEVDE